MPSLRQILRENSPVLLIDAASARIQVGLLDAAAPPRWSASTEEAGVAVFACLDELGADIARVRAFAFCEGPGSILGIRTTAMALRAWNVLSPRPTFAYFSLAVIALALARPGADAIADARRGHWHRWGEGGRLECVPLAELAGEHLTPRELRHWDPLPPRTATVPYDLAALLARPEVAAADLFRPTAEPDAFLHRAPAYAEWTPQIHRAP
jgi:tRNA threonylcarbamoyladenosine biosynthesis protein TsaB